MGNDFGHVRLCVECGRGQASQGIQRCFDCEVKANPSQFYPCPMCRCPQWARRLCPFCDGDLTAMSRKFSGPNTFDFILSRQWEVDICRAVKRGDFTPNSKEGRKGFFMGGKTWKELEFLPAFNSDGICCETMWEIVVMPVFEEINKQWKDNPYIVDTSHILTTTELLLQKQKGIVNSDTKQK